MRSGTWRAVLAGICFVLASAFAQAEMAAIEYLDTRGLPASLAGQSGQSVTHLLNGEAASALINSQSMLDSAQALEEETRLRLEINHGVLMIAAGDVAAGRDQVRRALDAYESLADALDPVLVNAYMALGIADFASENWEEARDSIHTAQALVHRTEGVLSPAQQDMLYYLTMIDLYTGDATRADQLQLLSLRIDEHAYGKNSRQLIPTLNRLGAYFSARGSMYRQVNLGEIRPNHAFLGSNFCLPPTITDPRIRIMVECFPGLEKWQNQQTYSSRKASEMLTSREKLFNSAVEMFERALELHRQNPGYMEYNLVQTVTDMAKAYAQSGSTRSALMTLREAVALDETYPHPQVDERIRLLVEMGDYLMLLSDTQAYDVYLRAAELYAEHYPDDSSSPFETPVRLKPGSFKSFSRSQLAELDEADYFAVLNFDVSSEGRVENVRVLEANVPGTQLRNITMELKRARFRPRIEEGELARAADRRIRFSYRPSLPAT